jgi:hypothetical protein
MKFLPLTPRIRIACDGSHNFTIEVRPTPAHGWRPRGHYGRLDHALIRVLVAPYTVPLMTEAETISVKEYIEHLDKLMASFHAKLRKHLNSQGGIRKRWTDKENS